MGADAADDPIARDRERGGGRQRRVHRADDAVRDDHARSLDAAPSPAAKGRAPAERVRAVRSRPSDRRADLGFESPLALLSLVVLPLAVGRLPPRAASSAPVRRPLHEPRRAPAVVAPRGAPRRERVDRRPRRRRARLLCLAVARPQMTRSQPVENATVVLVLDTSRSMLSRRRRSDAARGGEAGRAGVPRPRPRAAAHRARHVRRRRDRRRLPDPRPRAGARESVAAITQWQAGAARRSATRSCARSRSAATRSARRSCRGVRARRRTTRAPSRSCSSPTGARTAG